MRKKKYCKDYIDEAIAAGAYVLPPTASVEEASMEPVTTPTEPIMIPDPPYRLVERKSVTEPPAEPSVEVEQAAEKLQRHWNPGQPSVAAESPGTKEADWAKYTLHQVKAEISDWHDAVGTGVGFAFILPKRERRGCLYIRESDVISTSGKIHVGSFIRAEVAPPSGVNRSFEGRRIDLPNQN